MAKNKSDNSTSNVDIDDLLEYIDKDIEKDIEKEKEKRGIIYSIFILGGFLLIVVLLHLVFS